MRTGHWSHERNIKFLGCYCSLYEDKDQEYQNIWKHDYKHF